MYGERPEAGDNLVNDEVEEVFAGIMGVVILKILVVDEETYEESGDSLVDKEGLNKVFVEISQDLMLFFLDFCLESFKFSDFEELISVLRFLTVVAMFSHFCSSLNISLSYAFRDLFCCLISLF